MKTNEERIAEIRLQIGCRADDRYAGMEQEVYDFLDQFEFFIRKSEARRIGKLLETVHLWPLREGAETWWCCTKTWKLPKARNTVYPDPITALEFGPEDE